MIIGSQEQEEQLKTLLVSWQQSGAFFADLFVLLQALWKGLSRRQCVCIITCDSQKMPTIFQMGFVDREDGNGDIIPCD